MWNISGSRRDERDKRELEYGKGDEIREIKEADNLLEGLVILIRLGEKGTKWPKRNFFQKAEEKFSKWR